MTNQLTFNENQVRKSLKSRLCGEFVLPSGKPSGFYKFPITDEEINDIMKEFSDLEKPKGFLTWSEWALWVALRSKYGCNYLKPKKQHCLSHIDDFYRDPKKDDDLQDKLLFYCDSKLEEILTLACRQNSEEKSEKSEKNFRSSLDNDDLDVLY